MNVGFLVACVAVMATRTAAADTISVTGANCTVDCVTYNDTGSTAAAPINTISFGNLTNPVNVAFGDNLGTNSTTGSIVTTDDYLFMVPTTSASASISGDQVWLNGFTGTVDSFSLIDTSTGDTIATGTPTSPFSSLLLDSNVDSGMYELKVVATLNAGATGSYDGVLVANAPAPVPVPAAAWLLLSGLGGLRALTHKRKA